MPGERFDAIVSNPPLRPGAHATTSPRAGPRARGTPAATAARCSTASASRRPATCGPAASLLVVHSSLLGYERTAELLAGAAAWRSISRPSERGPLGPLMNGRRAHLEAEGLLARGPG